MLAWKNGINFDMVDTGRLRSGYDDRPQVGDFNGDGLPDIALAFNNVWNLWFHKPGQPNLMTSINPGDRRFDDIITVNYQPLTNSSFKPFGDETPLYTMGNRIQCIEVLFCNTRGIVAPIYVTAVYTKNNGIPTAEGGLGVRRFAYAYENARVDISGRGFLGFGKQTVQDGATSFYTASTFHRDFPWTGLVDLTETRRDSVSDG